MPLSVYAKIERLWRIGFSIIYISRMAGVEYKTALGVIEKLRAADHGNQEITSQQGSEAVLQGTSADDRVELYCVRRGDGKLCTQSRTLELAEREVEWHVASGIAGPFTIDRILKRPDIERWGICLPSRYNGPWPTAKQRDFIERYKAGETIRELEKYFGTSPVSINNLARKNGLQKRPDDPSRWEKYGGKWTGREEELINLMYDDRIPIADIAGNIPRTKSAIEARLRDTAELLSTRSKLGRFIVKPGPGRRGISPVLEPTSGADGDGQESG